MTQPNGTQEILFSIDETRYNDGETQILHGILAAVSFAGIMELSGGAPTDRRAILVTVQLFTLGLIGNTFGYISSYYIKDFFTKKYGTSVGRLKQQILLMSFIGPMGGVGAVLHYYDRWICYCYWAIIFALVVVCHPTGTISRRKQLLMEIAFVTCTIALSFVLLYFFPITFEFSLGLSIYIFMTNMLRFFCSGVDPEKAYQADRSPARTAKRRLPRFGVSHRLSRRRILNQRKKGS